MSQEEMQDIITVWTIQPWTVWEQVAAQGTLTVDPRYSAELHYAYEWLRERLPRHIAGYTGHYPWWSYVTRPDLRERRHNKPGGERHVLIELDMPRALVVVFPFWAWDRVFDQEYLSPNQLEIEEWEQRLREAVVDLDDHPLPEPWWTELQTSWERVFDPTLPQSWLWKYRRPVSEQEAVFEVLDRRYVRRVTPFIGASLTAKTRTPFFLN